VERFRIRRPWLLYRQLTSLVKSRRALHHLQTPPLMGPSGRPIDQWWALWEQPGMVSGITDSFALAAGAGERGPGRVDGSPASLCSDGEGVLRPLLWSASPSTLPFNSLIARRAPALVDISTQPKPFERPEGVSVMTTAESTLPACSNQVLSSASVVSNGSPPT